MNSVNKLTENDICMGLMTSESEKCLPGTFPYRDRSRRILNGYGKNLKNIYFFTDDYVDDERYLNVCKDSTIDSNKPKWINGILELYEMNLGCKYYIIGDDDNYFFIKNILNFLNQEKTYNELIFYGRDINNKDFAYWGDRELTYCGGGGMIFTEKSFTVLAKYIKNNLEEVLNDELFSNFADVTIGYICKYNKIKLIQDDRFHTVSYADHTPFFDGDPFWDEKCKSLLEDMFSLHYIRDDRTVNFIKKYYEEA